MREVWMTQAAAMGGAVANRAYGMCATSILNEKSVCSDMRKVWITKASVLGGAVGNRAYGICSVFVLRPGPL